MQKASFSEQLSPLEWGPLSNDRFLELLATYKLAKIAILVDENTHDHCLPYLLTGFDELANSEIIMLPAGEENKVLEVCFQVWETLTEAGFGRHDLLLNLGGGMVTDLGGFVASVYKRGIAFVNIPTSLLAIVDAAVGGKTGIDLAGYKNQIGTFQDPLTTFIDIGFLNSLPEEEWRNGFAELIKHALIADKSLWQGLVDIQHIRQELSPDFIQKGVHIKQAIVLEDPKEKGLRKILNFGHTIGHALESYYLAQSNPIAHGHCVAIGMLIEAKISQLQVGLSSKAFDEIAACIKRHFTLHIPTEIDAVWSLMQQDKKNQNGEVRCCLLSKIGTCVYDQTLTYDSYAIAMQYFQH